MKNISAQFEQWKAALDDFQKNVEKDLEEIRRQKSEVQEMKNDILDRMDKGQFIRDEERIVISAPEIIIGNVDHSGVLWNKKAPGTVIIRSNDVALEAVDLGMSKAGTIISRASSIRNIAVDPGKDGLELVAGDVSEIIMHGRDIGIVSSSANDYFTESPLAGAAGGIFIHSDKRVDIEAAPACESLEVNLKNTNANLKTRISELKEEVTRDKTQIDLLMKRMKLLVSIPDINAEELSLRTDFINLEEQYEEFKELSDSLYKAMTACFRTLSMLAEANRQAASVKNQSEAVSKKKDKFAEKTTGASINMKAERVNIKSMDGDGKLRINPEAGVSIQAKNMDFYANAFDNSLIKNGRFSVSAQSVGISTVNAKIEKDKADYPAEGNVIVSSKNITFEAVDREFKDKKVQEKALTAGGCFEVRAETVNVSATDTEGKATGQVEINAKNLQLKSMDVDKEKRTDKNLATGSSMLLLSEKMYAGGRDKDNKSKLVQVSSDKVGVFAQTTLELQQDEGKSSIQLDGGNFSATGNKSNLYGETTLNGKTTFKADVKAGTVEVDNIKIGQSFKSPCTTEGIAIPGVPSSAKLSTKLKEEDAPKNENKK
ncbi:MAG: hypothetical protein RR304_00845 [Bacteroides sp.]